MKKRKRKRKRKRKKEGPNNFALAYLAVFFFFI